MRLHPRLAALLGCLSVLLVPCLLAAQEQPPRQASLNDLGLTSKLETRRNPVVQAVERVKGAVVNIHSERTVAAADGYSITPSQNRVNGMGTGIVIDPRGFIVTNQHVIDDVNMLRIRLCDGTSVTARVVGRHPETDLALLKIDVGTPLPIMPLGTAADLMVGETVIALGNAYGYEHTVSRGIVSAIKRDVNLNKDLTYRQLIQTDASINPGNSGGPLVNIYGDLVGVNVAIRAGAQGIGFAIPVDQMIGSVAEMFRGQRRLRNYDGLGCVDHVAPVRDGLIRTVVVERIDSSSPANIAGVQIGDEVVSLGDTKVLCTYDIERALLERRPGELVSLVVRRKGTEQRLDLVLGSPDRRVRPSSATDVIWAKLGMLLNPVSGDEVAKSNRQLHGGLEVTAVNAEGVAARAGIKKGDILVGLHNWETLSVDNVTYVLGHPDLASFNPLSFFVLRGGQVRRGYLNQVH